MSEYETHKVETEAGTFYVRVLAAERKTYYSGGAHREEIQPRAWISTDPEFESNVELGHVKIRGRKYSVEHMVKRMPGWSNEYETREPYWQTESSYRGGYRNDKRGPVSYEAKAYDQLRGMESAALDRFAEQHPDWVRESTRRLFEQERDNHLRKKRSLELEADHEDIEAARWQKRLDDLLATA
ncbi:hypothetical protein KGG77_gp11 [Streptomyces phage Omar]|uniref:Uncharacterized protein n=1 Tax=Streptomyces phage Omar TaxID=2059882 RepID=A0A2H5BLS3_9CAUD|nr:hypothetical protein KGG77_gp11 [Streptomyces phage Omar]AUG87257.1 hypothetical protein SEA_OMAR_73 [Streptomyces phage Omar]